MTRVVRALSEAHKSAVRTGVRALLVEVDAEFLPQLSARTDTLSMVPRTEPGKPGASAYLEAMGFEHWLVALCGESVVGLISFTSTNRHPVLAPWSPSLYATTVAVSPHARCLGVGTALYDEFEGVARQWGLPFLTTRTWTTNDDHLRLLSARGFRRVIELPHDREPHVGTVYLAYSVGDPVQNAYQGGQVKSYQRPPAP